MATTDNNAPKTPSRKPPVRRKSASTAKKPGTSKAIVPTDYPSVGQPGVQAGLRKEARKVISKLKTSARDAANEGKAKTTSTLDDVSALVDDVARTLEERVGPQYSTYARRAADALSGVSDSLKAKDVQELLDDARDFIRRKPAIAIGAAAALGFVVTRLLAADQGDQGDDA